MENEDSIYINRILLLLTFPGLNPKEVVVSWRKYLTSGLCLLQLGLSTFGLFQAERKLELDDLAEYVFIADACYAGICRILYVVIKRQQLQKILNETKYFWDINMLGDPLSEPIISIVRFSRLMIQSNIILTFACVICFFLLPWFVASDELPLFSYNDYTYIPYWVLYLQQVCWCLLLMPVTLGFDGLFGFITSRAVAEMKAISIILSSIELPQLNLSYRERFKEGIRHHINVLSFLKNTNNMYSAFLFNQFIVSQLSLCFSMFVLANIEFPPSPGVLMKYLTLVGCYLFQLSIYCFMGNDVTYECTTICTSIFHNKWNQRGIDKQDKQNMLIAMHRSQLRETISIGGFFDLNVETLSKVVRQAFSVLACLQAVNNREVKK